MKSIVLIAVVFAVVTQSGCVSYRVAKYAAHRAAKARKEARKEARKDTRESRRDAESQEASRAEPGNYPLAPRDDARSDFR